MFEIKFNVTKKLGIIDNEDISVSEAIWSIYPNYDENVIITFGNYLIYLDKRGDIAGMYNDIIYMLKDLNENENEFQMSFLSSGFTVYWNFKKEENLITITPKWISAGLKDRETNLFVQNVREANFPITVNTDVFISEWHKLLKNIKDDLLKVGYTEDLENFEYLKNL
ncbi:hypothetical protein [Chryseobacterium hagamense]|uniref:Uncharacterized protein n=1 Tax=Chryseobacterium hagamense TaxID=395935 RepID=A0A511YST1_9FLAO|nr:hypothetical protein [Chryseobacterium hagamense]GEN78243.1 hypothetical protein CHA01nite_39830 [Chryseobacterium hagamense]